MITGSTLILQDIYVVALYLFFPLNMWFPYIFNINIIELTLEETNKSLMIHLSYYKGIPSFVI